MLRQDSPRPFSRLLEKTRVGWAAPIRYALLARKDLIVARLARVEGLVVAYLFGSQARGTASAASDVDVPS